MDRVDLDEIMCEAASAAVDAGQRVVLPLGCPEEVAASVIDRAEEYGTPVVEIDDDRHLEHGVAVVPTGDVPDLWAWIRRRFRGLCVVGDVHGESEQLEIVVRWAERGQRFLVLLGDIVDHGSDSEGALSIVADLVQQGRAVALYGNHDIVLYRCLPEGRTTDSDGDNFVPAMLAARGATRSSSIVRDAVVLAASGRTWLPVANLRMAHAGYASWFPEGGRCRALSGRIAEIAIYGRGEKCPDEFDRDVIVLTGHERTPNDMPVIETGKTGARWIRLDTGAGKGGRLSFADFEFEGGVPRYVCSWMVQRADMRPRG